MEYPSLSTPPSGSIRFNTDSRKMEIYNGEAWWEIDATSPEQQTGGTRGITGGGYTPSAVDVIQYANIDTTGNYIDFGNLIAADQGMAACFTRTRALWAGGEPSGVTNVIQYVTISSTGNATDWGDLSTARRAALGASNQTRGLIAGGSTPSATNAITFVTIASAGSGEIDFGDLTHTGYNSGAGYGSPTRAVFAGGETSPAGSHISSVQFATKGNATVWGDITGRTGNKMSQVYGCSNAVRGLNAGGQYDPSTSPNSCDIIDYVTIASLGNAIDFGNLTQARGSASAQASPTRGVFVSGYTPTKVNTCDYVQFASTGNAVDFGDTLNTVPNNSGSSNGHGGLG